MLTTLVALRLCALSQVLLFVAALIVSRAAPAVRGFGAAFGVAATCYLALPLIESGVDRRWFVVAVSLTHVAPLLFFLFLRALYEDRPLSRSIASASLAFAALALVAAAPHRSLVPLVALQLFKLLCVAATLAVVLRGRDADLIDARRASRPLVAAAVAMLMALIVIAELARGFHVEPVLETIGMGAILALAFLSNLAVMRFGAWFTAEARARGEGAIASSDADVSCPGAVEPASEQLPGAAAALIARLRSVMRDERLHADHDLRIGALATRLEVPEYRLRRTINGMLGYRNFNQFVNEYRLEEAASRLLSEPRTPVLTIALDVGFRSISSFNAAFRARFGRSAGEYRRRRLTGI